MSIAIRTHRRANGLFFSAILSIDTSDQPPEKEAAPYAKGKKSGNLLPRIYSAPD